MDIELLNLTHQEWLEKRFQRMALDLSEYTFANVYLFREVHQFEVIQSKDIYIKGKTREGFKYLMPTSPVEELNFEDLIDCLQGCDFIFPIPQVWVPWFDPQIFHSLFLEQDSDYFYSIAKLSRYAGRHLSGRRNLVKQFNEFFPEHHDFPLDASRVSDAHLVLEEWHQHAKEEAFTDYAPCREALDLIEPLHLTGHISYVEDKPVGFLLGEPLNSGVYVIHFAKALIEYKGVYQYLYQQFAKVLEDKNFECINLEQDLGSIELKHAKRSYQPDDYAVKYRISSLIPVQACIKIL